MRSTPNPPIGGYPPRILVTLSGGMDSAVLAAYLSQTVEVITISIDYGQRHRKELDCAAEVALFLGLKSSRIDLSGLGSAYPANALTGSLPVPDGHYAAESMRATVVPNRNMILLAVAAGAAISEDCGAIAYGAHAGDHAIYPDCRPAFADAMGEALSVCHYSPIQFLRPFIGITKADIVTLGDSLGVPFALTWSCYRGGEIHCGSCGTCVERREAFILAEVSDPTTYDPAAPSLSELLARAPSEPRGI